MSKLISEADKLLERGKIPEALEKLKAAQKAEPLNQLVATKLANVYVDQDNTEQAVKVLTALAERLSEAGKAQLAIAIYKQAIELGPHDVQLKVKFAIECEIAGKINEAQTNAQNALRYFLSRKKYFDAANLMPLLARLLPRDEKVKEMWIEILQMAQAEQKLIHLLVAFCGPPGLLSPEFPVGGEPNELSLNLYEGIKRLAFFFPRDPKITYAIAWAAHQRGQKKDLYLFVRDTLGRDPDYCLALLLFSRALAEEKKLNEALFVFKHLKERQAADKSTDQVTLNQLIDGFLEKNGWINFSEGEELDAASFLRSITGQLSPPPVKRVSPPLPPPIPPPVTQKAPPPIPTLEVAGELTITNINVPAPSAPSTEPVKETASSGVPAEIELTNVGGEELELQFTIPANSKSPPTSTPPPKTPPITFSPFDSGSEPGAAPVAATREQDPTVLFSPLELLGAGNKRALADANVQTKGIVSKPEDLAAMLVDKEVGNATQSVPMEAEEQVSGEKTVVFSPMEVIDAAVQSRRSFQSSNEKPEAPPLSGAESETIEAREATVIIPGAAEVAAESELAPELLKKLFAPIPDRKAAPEVVASPPREVIDSGEDLLNDPTKILVTKARPEPTNHLLKELKEELRANNPGPVNAELLFKKAERYVARRNYYMARKVLRLALASGGDEARIKERLSDIRRLERPEGFYQAVSSDDTSNERSEEILEKLEREFDLCIDDDRDVEAIGKKIDYQLENIFRETDPRTLLDFGVALHEMGLFRQAENLFSRMVDEFPETSFDAYYLAAVSKLARKDYAGAASILQILKNDGARSEIEKIQIYYALGELFEKMERPESSREFFQKVAELDANYRNIRNKLEK